jgi:transcriptional regulator with XRE-family HTH domain
MADDLNPAILRRRLRTELKRARTESGLTQRDAAGELDWSPSKLIRIESGSVGITPVDLRALLALYGVTDDATVEPLVQMARASRKSTWADYREYVPREFMIYLENEASAASIRQAEPLLVPGLLQTEEYARAVLENSVRSSDGVRPGESDRIDRLWEIRETRQSIFEQTDPPAMAFVLDEAAVRRHVGGARVMRRQLEHLKDISSNEKADIRVIPFSAGAHLGMRGPFTVLDFPEDDPVLYFENNLGDSINRDNPELTSEYATNFLDLQELGLAGAPLESLLDEIIAELSRAGGRPSTRAASPT